MRTLTSVLLLGLSFTTACAAAPTPPPAVATTPPAAPRPPRSALAARAPATTRVLFRLGPSQATVNMATDGAVVALVGLCGLDPIHDFLGAEGWVTTSGSVHAEITGTLTAKKVECLAAAFELAITGRISPSPLDPFHITERSGGLVLSSGGDSDTGSGAPEALARHFDDLVAGGADLVVATSAGTPPYDATMRLRGETGVFELQIGHDRAERAAAVLAPLLVRSHDPLLDGVTVAAKGDQLVIGIKSSSPAAASLALRREVVEPFNIPSQPMSPTLLVGDHCLVVKDVPARAPARGEVIVFEYEPGKNFVKRVIGVPGDHLVIDGDALTINGVLVADVPTGEVVLDDLHDGKPAVRGAGFRETIGEHTYTVMRDGEPWGEPMEVDVAAGEVFVMGDNRHNSFDSRSYGGVPFGKILGRAAVITWSTGERGIRWKRVGQPVD